MDESNCAEFADVFLMDVQPYMVVPKPTDRNQTTYSGWIYSFRMNGKEFNVNSDTFDGRTLLNEKKEPVRGVAYIGFSGKTDDKKHLKAKLFKFVKR